MVATVLTVYGIETILQNIEIDRKIWSVATVLTVYGIETIKVDLIVYYNNESCNSTYRLRY